MKTSAKILPVLAAMTAIGPFSLDAYLPSFPYIAADLGVDPIAVGYSLSAYLFGMSFGQMLGGPISDQIGRRRVAISGLILFLIMSIVICFVTQLEYLILARVLQAVGGGAAGAVVMPTVRDISAPSQVAGRIALVFLIMMCAPLIAPAIGVMLMQFGWRWIFAFLAVYSSALAIIYFIRIAESKTENLQKLNFRKIFSQYAFVLNHKIEGTRFSLRYGLSAALSSCIMLIYVTNASFIFQTYFGVADAYFPLFFGANVAVLAIVQSISARYLRDRNLVEIAAYFRFGQRAQLVAVSVLALAVAIGYIPLWLFVPLIMSCLACLGINGSSGSGLYLAAFKRHSGSASALLTTATFLFGAFLGFLSGVINQGNLVSVVGMLLLAVLSANFVLLTIPLSREKIILEKLNSGEIEAV